jgi:hypothetical protein
MTMADFADQLFDWQDRLFSNAEGRLEFRGNRWNSLWPALAGLTARLGADRVAGDTTLFHSHRERRPDLERTELTVKRSSVRSGAVKTSHWIDPPGKTHSVANERDSHVTGAGGPTLVV